jgi:hypothetical protein
VALKSISGLSIEEFGDSKAHHCGNPKNFFLNRWIPTTYSKVTNSERVDTKKTAQLNLEVSF